MEALRQAFIVYDRAHVVDAEPFATIAPRIRGSAVSGESR